MNNIKSLKNEIKEQQIKPDLVIFDLDGCVINSDDFVITKKQAYLQKDKYSFDESIMTLPIEKPKPSEENDFCIEHLYNTHHLIPAYSGILDMFVRFATSSNVAIVTSRFEILRSKTINWLKEKITERYNSSIWRQVRYQIYFNEEKEQTLKFKKSMISKLMKTYNISLMVEDHPEVIKWAKSKDIMVLVPSTGYKDLNGKDLSNDKL